MAALCVFFQDVIEQFLTVVKIRALQQRERIGQVEETTLRCSREKTQRSGDFESFSQRYRRAFAFVNENEVGPRVTPRVRADFSPSSNA